MLLPFARTFATLLGLAFVPLAVAPSTPKEDLLAAAAAGATRKVADALAAGADANARNDKGQTALMLAAGADAFAPCRELLWAGADANAKDRKGRTALEQIPAETQANVPLRFLLRSFAYLQRNAQRSNAKPANPSLTMIMEDTVNYLHPKLKAAYQVNNVELLGKTGVDDDKDGFVDDVYGWMPGSNRPYKIRAAQIDAYMKHRDVIARIIQVDEDRASGRITKEEAQLRLSEHTNPLSDIMGPVDGLSDRDFLNMLSEAAHGSHVAGIVLDASDGKARLHTMVVDFAEDTRRPLGKDSDAALEQAHGASFDPEKVLKDIRARMLAHRTERGRVMDRYLRTTGAGVVNMSFGGGLPFWNRFAHRQIKRCLDDHREKDPSADLAENIDTLAERWGLELYTAAIADLALLMYSNPDVLFVVAAGNESVDNDVELTAPAYLARFFPNVIAVAACNAVDGFCDFSNYGVESVDVAAPGEDIVSTVIPEASMRMNGTSMAAPYVAGVAALARSINPSAGAGELRRLIDYTARDIESFHAYVSSGGIVDKEMLTALFTGNARGQSNAEARIACNAAMLVDDVYPRHAADAERASNRAVELDATNAEAWRARAVTVLAAGDANKALGYIDKSVELDPGSEPAWMDRAQIKSQLQDNDGVFESLGKAIAVLEAGGHQNDYLRGRRLVLRAGLYLQLGETEKARADAKVAREINPWADMSEDLQALL